MQNLDALDEQILSMIADNARIPFLEVARVCHVSGAAIHQHIQKLTQMGVIKGSQFVFDPEALGYGTCAFVGLFLKDPSDFDRVVAELRCIPEVVECHYTTGNYDIFIKIYAHNNHHLLSIIHDKLQPLGIQRSETIISFNEAFNRQFPVPNTAERLSEADGEPCTAEELSGEGLVTDATQALRGENRLPNTTPSSNAKSSEPGAIVPSSNAKSSEPGAIVPSSNAKSMEPGAKVPSSFGNGKKFVAKATSSSGKGSEHGAKATSVGKGNKSRATAKPAGEGAV